MIAPVRALQKLEQRLTHDAMIIVLRRSETGARQSIDSLYLADVFRQLADSFESGFDRSLMGCTFPNHGIRDWGNQ